MKKTKVKENTATPTNLFTKTLLILYLIVGLSYKVVEVEYEGFQWFYFSILNFIALGYIYYTKETNTAFKIDKKAQQFFIVFLLLITISFLSLLKAINVSEGIVHILRLINVFTGIYIVYSLVKENPKVYFELVCKVCVILLAYQSFVTLNYYWGNFDKPRTHKLVGAFIHYYGNINFFTASLIVRLPFVFYLLYSSTQKIWRFLAGAIAFTTMLSIFYGGSRTAILSLSIIVIIIVITLIFKHLKGNINKKRNLAYLSYFIAAPLLTVFIFLNTNRVHKTKMNSINFIGSSIGTNYKETTKFLEKNPQLKNIKITIPKKEDSYSTKLLKRSGRYLAWTEAWNMFTSNPLLGVGYGNFKVHPKPWYYHNKLRGNGKYSSVIRVHNDFFEKFTETGIIGGLLFLALFILIFKVIINLLKKKVNEKTMVFALLLSGIAYTLDAFFNFPLERVPVELYFVLISAFILAIQYKNNKTEITKLNLKIIQITLLTILGISTILNYMIFKVYSVNTILKNKEEFKRRGYDLSYAGLEKLFYNFPDLDQDGIKVAYYKASKALEEKKYDKALEIVNQSLDKETNTTSNILLYNIKAQTFVRGYKKIDSGEYYYKLGYEKCPPFKNNYINLINIYKGQNRTKEREALMHNYNKKNYVDITEWTKKIDYFNKKNGNHSYGLKIIDTALAYNPNNLTLLKAKQKLIKSNKTKAYYRTKETTEKYKEIVKLYNDKKYLKAKKILNELLQQNKEDFYAIQYLGIVEMNLKNYNKAIKYLSETIYSKVFKDGKAEYCRGFCYEKLGDKEKAKKDYKISRERKYPLALKLAPSKYE